MRQRKFRTFDQVLAGLRELRTAGWQVRMQPAYADQRRQRVAMLRPGDIDWRFSRDPLEALAEHFVPGAMFDGLLIEQAGVLGLRFSEVQWIYAVGAEDHRYLEHQLDRPYVRDYFAQQRRQLLTAVGLAPA